MLPDSTFNFHLEEHLLLSPIRMQDATPFSEAPWYIPGDWSPAIPGVEGVLPPYNPANDDGVAAVVLLAFLMAVWTLVRSWHFKTEVHGGTPLWLLATCATCLMVHLAGVPLGVALAASAAAEALRVAVYGVVNSTFFTSLQRQQWRDTMRITLWVQSVLLWLVSLWGIYGGAEVIWWGFLAVGLVKLLLLVRAERTFFPLSPAGLHLFLYFCTLEVLPFLALMTIYIPHQ